MLDDFLTTNEFCELHHVSPRTAERWRVTGKRSCIARLTLSNGPPVAHFSIAPTNLREQSLKGVGNERPSKGKPGAAKRKPDR